MRASRLLVEATQPGIELHPARSTTCSRVVVILEVQVGPAEIVNRTQDPGLLVEIYRSPSLREDDGFALTSESSPGVTLPWGPSTTTVFPRSAPSSATPLRFASRPTSVFLSRLPLTMVPASSDTFGPI